jgi:hypothetical protein
MPATVTRTSARRLEQMRERVSRNVEYVYSAKDSPCLKCEQSFPPVCMDFHHRDRASKHTIVATLVWRGVSLAMIQAEIDKCDLLCANCHRLEEWELKQCPQL